MPLYGHNGNHFHPIELPKELFRQQLLHQQNLLVQQLVLILCNCCIVDGGGE